MKPATSLLIALSVITAFSIVPATARAADSANGKTLYEARCAFCHGMSGKGDGIAGAGLKPPPANFTSPDFWKDATPEKMRKAIEEGEPGTAMVGFKATLKPGELDDLLAHLDSFKAK